MKPLKQNENDQRAGAMSADLHAALQAMNEATYAAARAARAAGDHDLHIGLRNIALWSDEQVDRAAPGVRVKA